MSITSWITKSQTKEIIKGIIQAVKELLDELLASQKQVRETTSVKPTAIKIDNGYPTKQELEKQRAHEILKGNK